MTSLSRRKANADPKTAQLLLLLGDQQYAVVPSVGVPSGCRQFWLTKLPTSLSDRVVYTVTQRVSGHLDCTCPDCVYRQRSCKHLKAMVALGILDDPDGQPEPPTPLAHAPECDCSSCDPFSRVA